VRHFATVLTTAALTACAAQAVPLTVPKLGPAVGELGTAVEATLVAAEQALARTLPPDPGRGPWRNVADLDFLPGGGGVVEEGPVRFSWRLNLRNQGLDHDTMAAELTAAAQALAGLELQACEVMEIDIYEVETAYANESGRFDLAMEPGAGQVLVGVYDPRNLEPGLAAIVLTPLPSPVERQALVAHELAHQVHNACHLSGDSEAFAERVEALFHSPRSPDRLASAPAKTPTGSPGVALEDPPDTGSVAAPPTAVRGRPPAHARARTARLRRAHAAHARR